MYKTSIESKRTRTVKSLRSPDIKASNCIHTHCWYYGQSIKQQQKAWERHSVKRWRNRNRLIVLVSCARCISKPRQSGRKKYKSRLKTWRKLQQTPFNLEAIAVEDEHSNMPKSGLPFGNPQVLESDFRTVESVDSKECFGRVFDESWKFSTCWMWTSIPNDD